MRLKASPRIQMAVSSGERNGLGEDFVWFHPAEGLPRAAVELVGDGIEVLLGVGGEIGFLAEIWTEQAFGIFASPALPGATRIAEVGGHAGVGVPVSEGATAEGFRFQRPVQGAGDRGRAARFSLELPGLGGRGDGSSPRGHRGSLGARRPEQGEAAYRRTDLFERRRRLMGDWGVYLASGTAKYSEPRDNIG